MNTINRAKVMAKALRKALAEKQVEVSHSVCLELIAQQLGYSDWNVLCAACSSEITVAATIFVEHGRQQEAANFYEAAFGAVQTKAHTQDGQKIAIELQIGEVAISVSGSNPKREAEPWRGGPFFPKERGAVSTTFQLEVSDADAYLSRAVIAGAAVRDELQVSAGGGLAATIFDPMGHIWSICQRSSGTAKRAA
ncbi:glyoxalase superfamily protein [Microvirga rosea]|uniref:glyoxalase superfamily protein n=1 Tax=Microvirga rosea TaxID=2715425 RepID=UPI001D0B200A|nr:glyoxalase superfamily protein [Microvirga rosea]MCB8822887.1 VOC family protein [Microvirga rosea]